MARASLFARAAIALTAWLTIACGTDATTPTSSLPACATGDKANLADCVEQPRYVNDLKFITGDRPTGSAHHKAVREMLVKRLGELGLTVTEQTYGQGTNVIGTLTGTKSPDELVIIGAHYDGVPGCVAADDNGTGVAGALEVARVLASGKWDRSLVVVFWDEEERGLTGSVHHAASLAKAGQKVAAVYDFEMIGYTDKTKDSQKLPTGFGLLFPTVGAYLDKNNNAGDFIAVIQGKDDKASADAFTAAAAKIGLPAPTVPLDDALMTASAIADLRRSDHASYWSHGYPAIMLTDTANFRNENYHCTAGADTVDRLDHAFAEQVIKATANASIALLAATGGPAFAAKQPACDLDKQDCKVGQKCTIFADSGSRLQATCVDVPKAAAKLNEACTRPNNKAGEDTCDKGLFCAWWGVPKADPVQRKCAKTCRSSDACGKDEVCAQVGWLAYGSAISPTGQGVCVARCDVFASSCAAGTQCEATLLDAGTLKRTATCLWPGTLAAGEVCSPRLMGECAAGLQCRYAADGSGAACRAPCDAAHPCAGGKVCEPDAYADSAGLGSCGG